MAYDCVILKQAATFINGLATPDRLSVFRCLDELSVDPFVDGKKKFVWGDPAPIVFKVFYESPWWISYSSDNKKVYVVNVGRLTDL